MSGRGGGTAPTRGGAPGAFAIATSGPVVRRALGYAAVVGALLIAINHFDALRRGDVDWLRGLQMALTVLVPYTVSTLSSVQALAGARPPEPGP